MRGSRTLAIALVILAVIFAVVAVVYFTQRTTFLASGHPIRHPERALVLIVLALVCLAAAIFARPRQTRI